MAFAGNKFGEGMLGPCSIDHVSGMLALFLSWLEIANRNQDFRSIVNLLAKHFQSQPLLLGCSQFIAHDGKRL